MRVFVDAAIPQHDDRNGLCARCVQLAEAIGRACVEGPHGESRHDLKSTITVNAWLLHATRLKGTKSLLHFLTFVMPPLQSANADIKDEKTMVSQLAVCYNACATTRLQMDAVDKRGENISGYLVSPNSKHFKMFYV